jgi:hypothetical protein
MVLILPEIAAYESPLAFADGPSKVKFIDKDSPDHAKISLIPIAEFYRRERGLDKTPFVPFLDHNVIGFFWDGSESPDKHLVLGGGQILADRTSAQILWMWLFPTLRDKPYIYNLCDYYRYRFNNPQV